ETVTGHVSADKPRYLPTAAQPEWRQVACADLSDHCRVLHAALPIEAHHVMRIAVREHNDVPCDQLQRVVVMQADLRGPLNEQMIYQQVRCPWRQHGSKYLG